MKIQRFKWCPLSKSNTFDQNFMKLGHIVKYHDIFFKFDNGPYLTILQELWPFVYENSLFKWCLHSKWNSLIRILWNFVTLFSTMMSSSSFVCLFCCFTSQVNSYGHCGTVSSPNHTFSWASLNKRLTSNSCILSLVTDNNPSWMNQRKRGEWP